MPLESPAVLAHLSSWLSCHDLCALRALNRDLYVAVPHQTWELTVAKIGSPETMAHLATVFPHVWCLRLQDAMLEAIPTMAALAPWLHANWKLRELALTRVACLRGFHVHMLTKEWAALEKLTLQQCYQVQMLAIIAPNLHSLVIVNCPVTKFHAETSMPMLKELSVSSRKLSTLQARGLVKNVLSGSPSLKKLSLSNCPKLEQVLIDPENLPALRELDLSNCAKLTRVHVSSKQLESLELSLNDQLQYILLDLDRVVNLDLSFLKSLTHLYIRSSSLRRLNLRGCSQLQRETTRVDCPNLQLVVLQGTALVVDDLNRNDESQRVFELPDAIQNP
ncbi:hypothetical protein BBJ28_00001509 [Nothophytophthora sp. Chile5]|nr:hypothetical protein BBJ28_00001509 [Nothophytophthora sp. Chile5]